MNGLEKIHSLLTGRKADTVICALYNADTDGVLLPLFSEEPQKILQGLNLAAEMVDAKEKLLYLPDFAQNLAETLQKSAEKEGIQIQTGIVDVRAHKEDLILSPDVLADLYDEKENAYQDGIYVDFEAAGLKKMPVSEVTARLSEMTDAKAVCIGWNYYDPKNLAELNLADCHLENATISVLRKEQCIVETLEQKIEKAIRQSCGKCVFCREGLLQFHYMLKEIRQGRGKDNYLDLMKEIAEAMTFSTECSMGQYTAELLLSSLEVLQEEYTLHIRKKECPAGICFSTETIYVDPKKCVGCGDCVDVCEKDCIEGKANYIHMLDEFDCDRCGKCIKNCPEEAIIKTSGKLPKLPKRLTKVGKFKR